MVNLNNLYLKEYRHFFGQGSEKYLILFLFFVAYPLVSIGNSITFYLLIVVLYQFLIVRKFNILWVSKWTIWFYLFSLAALFSLVFAPNISGVSLLGDIISLTQYYYWIIVAIFFLRMGNYLDQFQLSRILFYGLLFHTIHFYFFNSNFPLPFIRTFYSRNGYVYTILAIYPLVASYIYTKYGKMYGNLSLLLIFSIMLTTEGRAGVIVILIEILLIAIIYNRRFGRLLKPIVVSIIIFFLLIGDSNFSITREITAGIISPFSDRIANFVSGKGSAGDLSYDKSWLTRELMIEKSQEIIKEHPIFGVGVNHFTSYDSKLESLYSAKYLRLTGGNHDESYYNTRSAHNSYVHVLSEMGIVGFLLLIIILAPPLLYAFWKLFTSNLTVADMSLVSLIGICTHFYTITSLPGTISWFIIGMAYSRMLSNERSYA